MENDKYGEKCSGDVHLAALFISCDACDVTFLLILFYDMLVSIQFHLFILIQHVCIKDKK